MSWISVEYQSTVGNLETVCSSTEDVSDVSSTPEYTAKCDNGIAEIDIYAYDCTFIAVADIDGGIPAFCQAWKDSDKTDALPLHCAVRPHGLDVLLLNEPKCIPEASG